MPTEDGSGGLATSLWDSLPFVNGAGPARTAVVLTPPRCGLPLVFANGVDPARMAVVLKPPRCGLPLVFTNGVGPARMAVVLTPPLLAYGWCGWASSGMCRQRGRR